MWTGISAAPFRLGEQLSPNTGMWNVGAGFTDTGGRTLRAQTLNPAVRNLVLIIAGQSNMISIGSAAHTIVNGTVLDNFNVYDGATYAAAEPLLGTQYALASLGGDAKCCLGTKVGDGLITAGKFDRVLLVPVAIGSTVVSQWGNGEMKDRIPTAIARLAARGTVEGTNVTFAIMWGQGESDAVAGTSQANYQASFGQMVTRARAAGMAGKIFCAIQSRQTSTNNATIRAAQAACVNNGAGIYAGPDVDAITAGRYGDGTHLDTAGLASATTAWLAALAASGAPF